MTEPPPELETRAWIGSGLGAGAPTTRPSLDERGRDGLCLGSSFFSSLDTFDLPTLERGDLRLGVGLETSTRFPSGVNPSLKRTSELDLGRVLFLPASFGELELGETSAVDDVAVFFVSDSGEGGVGEDWLREVGGEDFCAEIFSIVVLGGMGKPGPGFA